MNKTELIEHIAQEAELTKAAATRALDALISGVSKSLKAGDTVSVLGFGTFDVSERAERIGRNPRTGESIKIVGSKMPKFRPGKALKDSLNG